MVFLYHFFAFLALHLPKRVAFLLVRVFASFRYWTTPVLRRCLQENLKVVLEGLGHDARQLKNLVKEGYLNFGLYLYEFFLTPKIDKKFLEDHLVVEGQEYLDSALQKGKGVISITAHLGNWEWAGIFTALLGYPVTAVALPHSNQSLNRFFFRRRQSKGVNVVSLGKDTKKIITALKRKELVALLGDRLFGPPAIEVRFFGHKTSLPAGPAELAVRFGCPLLPGFLVRKKNKYHLCFEPPLYPDKEGDSGQAVARLAEEAVFFLEKYIGTYPSQWLVFERIWKK